MVSDKNKERFPILETFLYFCKKNVMEDKFQNIGALIRDERIRRGMTQVELGAKVGVGKARISKIENGKGLTITTVTKVFEAMGVSATTKLSTSRNIDKQIIGYVVAAIHVFAKTYHLSVREASNYLTRYKGIDFLYEHYEAEHLMSMDDCVEDLAMVCYKQGGGIV